jgi:hypothetical protein
VYVGENERRRNRSLRRRRKKHYAEWDLILVYINIPPEEKREKDKRRRNERVQGDIKIFPGSILSRCVR